MAVLEAKGIAFRYRGGWRLGPLSLKVPGGSITALIGPNGAGKTTTMRILSGLMLPESGKILWNGKPAQNRWELARRVSFAASEPHFPAGARVRDLVRLRIGLSGASKKDEAKVMQKLQERLGRPLSVYPHRLSRGQRLMLAVELTLMGSPAMGSPAAVALDEPWAGLEPLAVEELLERLRRLAEEDVAVLISSHDLFALPEVADRYVFIVGGKVRAEGSLEELRLQSPRPDADAPTVLRELYRKMVAGG